jgi:predicted NAD/FAD-binding protein
MRESLLPLTVGLLIAAAAAHAAPTSTTRAVWATGQLVGVDAETRIVEIRQGNRELPFTVTPRARIVRGPATLDVTELAQDLGQRVRLRYTATPAARVADRVEVLGAATSTGE